MMKEIIEKSLVDIFVKGILPWRVLLNKEDYNILMSEMGEVIEDAEVGIILNFKGVLIERQPNFFPKDVPSVIVEDKLKNSPLGELRFFELKTLKEVQLFDKSEKVKQMLESRQN